jgi:hypothetical protein
MPHPNSGPAVIAMITTPRRRPKQHTSRGAGRRRPAEKFPKLADMMDASREDVLACHGVPKGTLGADRVYQPAGKGKQGDQAKGRCHRHLPNDAAVIRLVGALMLEQNDEWGCHAAMTLETIGSVSHNPVVSLPALAA